MATNPMHQFNVYRIGPEINLGGVDISFTNASLFMMISAFTIISLFFLATKKKAIIPTKIQLVSELCYSFVYKMISETGKCIYVGKAKNLKKRVSSYFSNLEAHTRKTQLMVSLVSSFEITVTENENEALILESNLIKNLRPRYNVLLRDDKSYPFVHLEEGHHFPRIKFHRGVRGKKGKYFGPFPNVYAVRETLNMLQKLFRVRQCDESFFKNRNRACLQYQIKRCSGPCVGLIDKSDYKNDVESAIMVLEGRNKEVLHRLSYQMERASSKLEFERAAKLSNPSNAATGNWI